MTTRKPLARVEPVPSVFLNIGAIVAGAFKLVANRGGGSHAFVCSSTPTTCPLCGFEVPANQVHQCSSRAVVEGRAVVVEAKPARRRRATR